MIKLDTSKDNGSSVFPLWKRLAIESLENTGSVPIGTKRIYDEVNAELKIEDDSISRASVINFVSALHEHGYIKGVPTTGKGGSRNDYCLISGRSHFDQLVSFRLLTALTRAYPAVNFKNMIGDL